MIVLIGFVNACGNVPAAFAPAPAIGGSERLETARTGLHAAARTGDLHMFDSRDAGLVISVAASGEGHRPLAGAIVDLLARQRDDAAADPLEWWRIGWIDSNNIFHPPSSAKVTLEAGCGAIAATSEMVTIKTRICPLKVGFVVRTTATGLPDGASIGDELQVGTSGSLVDDDGGAWQGEHKTRYIAFSEAGIAATLDAGNATASRQVIHFDDDVWPPAIFVRYGKMPIERRFIVSAGDALDSLGDAGAPVLAENVDLGRRGGTYALVGKSGRELFRGTIADKRVLAVPLALRCDLALRDADGFLLGPPRPLNGKSGPPMPRGTLHLEASAPVHVLFKGIDGTPDPELASTPDAIASGWSVYAVHARADVVLPVGHYAVTATRGPLETLDRFEIQIAEGTRLDHRVSLAFVDHPDGFIAADFHLHAAPSRDSAVSLAERAASLACEGIDAAVATDHDRITDYGPALQSLGLSRPVAIVGDEVTTAGRNAYGHFNAFPLPLPTGAPEDGVVPYFEVEPARLASSARHMGARVVQVNHARMDHAGFFDSAGLDPATGKTKNAYTDDFDALEVLNGMFIERPDKLREGAIDLVALARRGKRAAATGNSDSHGLMYEEPGYARTWVRAGSADAPNLAKRVIDTVLRGDTVASTGPLLDLKVEGQPPGSMVSPKKGKVHVTIRAYAAAWVPVETIEIWRDDAVVETIKADPPRDGLRASRELDVEVPRDAVIVAWASSEKPIPWVLPQTGARSVAVTTPVYVDADGDGRVISAPR